MQRIERIQKEKNVKCNEKNICFSLEEWFKEMSLYSEPDHVLQLITGLHDQQKAQQHCDVLLQHGRTIHPVNAAVFYILPSWQVKINEIQNSRLPVLSFCI